MTEPVRVFVSYARADGQDLKALLEHLSPLVTSGRIVIWSDEAVPDGQYWEPMLRDELERAELVLFLVTSKLLASRYVGTVELPRARRHLEEGTASVLPVIVRDCMWQELFAGLQARPRDARPIEAWSRQDAAWRDVAKAVAGIAARHRGGVAPDARPDESQNSPKATRRILLTLTIAATMSLALALALLVIGARPPTTAELSTELVRAGLVPVSPSCVLRLGAVFEGGIASANRLTPCVLDLSYTATSFVVPSTMALAPEYRSGHPYERRTLTLADIADFSERCAPLPAGKDVVVVSDVVVELGRNPEAECDEPVVGYRLTGATAISMPEVP